VEQARLVTVSVVDEHCVDESDVDAQRFYRRHGFSDVDPDSGERASYFLQELS